MSKRKSNPQVEVFAYFSLAPLEDCEQTFATVQALMRRRRKEAGKGRERKPRAPKVEPVEPVQHAEGQGTITRTFPPDAAAKAIGGTE